MFHSNFPFLMGGKSGHDSPCFIPCESIGRFNNATKKPWGTFNIRKENNLEFPDSPNKKEN